MTELKPFFEISVKTLLFTFSSIMPTLGGEWGIIRCILDHVLTASFYEHLNSPQSVGEAVCDGRVEVFGAIKVFSIARDGGRGRGGHVVCCAT